jgi:hypothetical protein
LWLDTSNFTPAGEQVARLADLTAPFRHSTFPTVTVTFKAAGDL